MLIKPKNTFLQRLVCAFCALSCFVAYGNIQKLCMTKNITPNLTSAIIAQSLLTITMTYFYYLLAVQGFNDRKFKLNQEPTVANSIDIFSSTGLMLAIQVIMNCLTTTSKNQAMIQQQFNLNAGITQALLIIIAPLFEELIFRGLFFQIFFTHDTPASNFWGILCNGLLFGYLHDPQLSMNFWTYAICGMLLAILYLRTKNIYCSFAAHAINNFLALVY